MKTPLAGGQPVSWRDAMAKIVERLAAAGTASPGGVRFLLSAHASHEELFLFRRLTEELIGERAGGQALEEAPRTIFVSWRVREKPQPEHAKFTVPPVDAPNVAGARVFGLAPGAPDDNGAADLSALKQAVQSGRVAALYVFDPGPEGSLGDCRWVVDARKSGKLPLLIVQGVLMTDLARAADFVLPGASYVEKDASYTNGQGRLQGTGRAIAPPGDAMEDWQILVNLAVALGVKFDYTSPAHVRADIAARYAGVKEIEGLTTLTFGQRISGRDWLQGSNPSERWKWDFMFQDLPPVKGSVDPSSLPLPPGAIQLRELK